jgi:GT2 family glycosyltransferase
MKITLVTVLYNSDLVLRDFLRSLHLQTKQDFLLVIVDNSPSDKSKLHLDTLLKEFPLQQVHYIANSKNLGVATGNNQGIKIGLENKSDFIILLNNDIVFDQNFLLEKIVEVAEQKSEDIVAPKIYFWDNKRIWMAGGWLNSWRGLTFHEGEGMEDSEQYSHAKYVNCVPTCFVLFRSKVFQEVGLMDEKYFVYYDDTDFLFRAQKNGYKIWFEPTLKLFHKVSSSTGGALSPFSIYYSTRNRIYFIRKNLTLGYKICALVWTILTRILKAFKYSPTQRTSLLKGIIDGWKMGR